MLSPAPRNTIADGAVWPKRPKSSEAWNGSVRHAFSVEGAAEMRDGLGRVLDGVEDVVVADAKRQSACFSFAAGEHLGSRGREKGADLTRRLDLFAGKLGHRVQLAPPRRDLGLPGLAQEHGSHGTHPIDIRVRPSPR
jgi:hypothetical protein